MQTLIIRVYHKMDFFYSDVNLEPEIFFIHNKQQVQLLVKNSNIGVRITKAESGG